MIKTYNENELCNDCKAEKYNDIKNEKQRNGQVSSHTYTTPAVESLIQRALHHMTGNSSQRGTLDLTTRTQIRFAHLRHTHPHIHGMICTNVNDKELPP